MLESLVLRALKQREKNLKKKKKHCQAWGSVVVVVFLILIFNLWLREHIFFLKGKLCEKQLMGNIFSILLLSNYYKFQYININVQEKEFCVSCYNFISISSLYSISDRSTITVQNNLTIIRISSVSWEIHFLPPSPFSCFSYVWLSNLYQFFSSGKKGERKVKNCIS